MLTGPVASQRGIYLPIESRSFSEPPAVFTGAPPVNMAGGLEKERDSIGK